MATKILLISADKKIESTFRQHTKDHSFSVSVEHSGPNALAKIKTNKPDMVLLDLEVTNKDAWEILEEMQKLKTQAKIPVVIVDQRNNHKNEVKAFEQGAASYTSKAVPAELLLQKLYSIQALAALQTRSKKPIIDHKEG